MTTFKENKIVTVFCWDLETLIFIGAKEYQAEKGLGLPSGMTLDPVSDISGKVAVMSKELGQWTYVNDDRGRIFYDKQNGQKFETTILGEVVNRRSFTAIAPPLVDGNQLVIFEDSQQKWIVGFDWYELPIWSAEQERSFFTGDFFVPNEYYTNIEPSDDQAGFVLNDLGEWIKPEVEPEIEE